MVLWDNWLAMALISAAAWALSCVVDACFVGGGVFRRPTDGPLVAGLLCIIPLLITHSDSDAIDLDAELIVAGGLAGISYLLHIYFYFKALFALNDASNAEIFNTLSVLIVPIMAFAILGEVLDDLDYFAIALAALGVLALVRLQLARLTWQAAAFLALSVTFVSLLMVMQAWLLRRADYGAAVWLFSAAVFGITVVGLGVHRTSLRRIVHILERFAPLLLAVQVLELGAVLGSQRATAVGPSVSLVALVECSLPLFVIGFSWLLHELARSRRIDAPESICDTLALQTTALPSKIVSLSLILVAITIVQR